MQLRGDKNDPRLVVIATGEDKTNLLRHWCQDKISELKTLNLSGLILKSNSPSCGVSRVKIYPLVKGKSFIEGKGLFAKAFLEHFPYIPLNDERQLALRQARERFLDQIFILLEWRQTLADVKTINHLIKFHSRMKFSILAHSSQIYRQIDRLLGNAQNLTLDQLYDEYGRLLVKALSLSATPSKHFSVLQHLAGFFKKLLTSREKKDLNRRLESYQAGKTPLFSATQMLSNLANLYNQRYLIQTYYLNPHPLHLKLLSAD